MDVVPDEPVQPLIKATPLNPEQRRARYLKNLDRLETLNLRDFYPPEMSKGEWEEVLESSERSDFLKRFSLEEIYGWSLDPRLISFKDTALQ